MYIVLFNPLSRSSKKIEKLEKILKKNKSEYQKFSILEKLDINDFAKNYQDKIIIIGGDGTLNVIFNYIRETKFEVKNQIFLYKAGTGNDFARSFKGKLIDITNSVKKLPIVKVNEEETGSKLFLNGCGLGVDGLICKAVNSSNKKGRFNFLSKTIKTLFKFKRINVTVNVDGEEYKFKKVWFCTVNNGKFQGGGMKMSPKSDRNDDILELLIIHSVNLFLIVFLFSLIYSGSHIKIKKYVFYKSGKNIKVSTENKVYFQLDGEVIDEVDCFEVKF